MAFLNQCIQLNKYFNHYRQDPILENYYADIADLERGAWSASTLSAYKSFYAKYDKNENIHQTPLSK